MGLRTQRQGQIGVNAVEGMILRHWRSRWQSIDSQNDDGVDGLIFIESNSEITGQVIYAQVKCLRAPVSKKGEYRIPISAERLSRNIERWRRLVGAAILIYVDPKTMQMFWVNLRDPAARGPSQVFVPLTQTFDRSAKQIVAALCGNIHRDLLAKRIETEACDFPHLRSREHIHEESRKLYVSLNTNPVFFKNSGPVIEFTRLGWRHITRKGRAQLTRYQSFVLLGTARKILEGTEECELKAHQSVSDSSSSFVSLRAAVSFPFRQTCIVKIILRRCRRGASMRYVFHTIYEPRRRRNVLGAREPLSQ
jgi:hypothetical protein